MRIIIETIPHAAQRYETVGDWLVGKEGILIRVSETGNEDSNFLIGIHEAIECYLCTKRGITMQQVNKFDNMYEYERATGLHGKEDEPGFDKRAPYRKEHAFADKIERMVAKALGRKWKEHEKAIAAL